MTPKEFEEAMQTIQKTSEGVLAGLQEQIKKKFAGVELLFSGRARDMTVSLTIAVKGEQAKFEEVRKFCAELEDVISYPEVKFIVQHAQ